MKHQVFRVEYFALTVDNRPGTEGELTQKLREHGISLLAFMAFPLSDGRTQLDLVPEDPDEFRRVAERLHLAVDEPKIAFLVQGADHPEAMGDAMHRVGAANVNVRAAVAAMCCDRGFTGLLWVNQQDVELASRALGAGTMVMHHV